MPSDPRIAEVLRIAPLALSPKAAAECLSLSRRQIGILIAEKKLIARKSGTRTLIDFASVRMFYEGLPLVAEPAPIPNAPKRHKRRARSATA